MTRVVLLLAPRHLPMIAALLHGRTHLNFQEFRQQNHLAFFLHVLGILELLQPRVFQSEHQGALWDCLRSFIHLLLVGAPQAVSPHSSAHTSSHASFCLCLTPVCSHRRAWSQSQSQATPPVASASLSGDQLSTEAPKPQHPLPGEPHILDLVPSPQHCWCQMPQSTLTKAKAKPGGVVTAHTYNHSPWVAEAGGL